MAIPAKTKTAIESFWATHGPQIMARQEAYFANHGHYWQGVEVFADILPANIPCQIRVDVYEGPRGHGWSLTVSKTRLRTLYRKTWQVGPETWRATDWNAIPVRSAAHVRAAMRSIRAAARSIRPPWYMRAWRWIGAQVGRLVGR